MSRVYRDLVGCLALCFALSMCACTTSMGPDDDGGGDNGNDGNGGGDDNRVRLTLTLRSLDGCRGLNPEAEFGCTGMDVFTFVDDVPHTRADAPYNNGTIAFRTNSRSSDPAVFPIDADLGQIVTLVAFESFGTNELFSNADDRDAFEETGRNRVEFLRFEQEGAALPQPESGVVVITMDSDKSVDAIYRRMPTLLISIGGETDPISPGFWSTITIAAPEWLTWPSAMGINPQNGSGGPVIIPVNGIAFIVEMKTGTKITFEAGDNQGFTFDRWDQSVSPCGGRACTLTLGIDEFATAHWRANP